MLDHESFLKAIFAQPEDDLPRLVYADYLEESGDSARAEFIRVQCDLDPLSPEDPAYAPLKMRELQLLEEHRSAWLIPDLRGAQTFRRGLVDKLETAAEWLLASAEVFNQTPIRSLRVANVDQHLEELARLPGLAHVQTLNLRANNLGAENRLARFFALGRFERLRNLNLQNNRIWPESLPDFLASPVISQLRTLHLSGNPIGDAGLEHLARAPGLTNLTRLILRNDEQPYSDSIHAVGAAALAQTSTLTQLRTLNLAGHHLGDAGLINLVNSPVVTHLEELDVSNNTIGTLGERSLEALTQSPHLRNLRELRLGGNELNRMAVKALLGWRQLRYGVRVDLRRISVQFEDLAQILDSPHERQIEYDWLDRSGDDGTS